jgi:hypothetical protein
VPAHCACVCCASGCSVRFATYGFSGVVGQELGRGKARQRAGVPCYRVIRYGGLEVGVEVGCALEVGMRLWTAVTMMLVSVHGMCGTGSALLQLLSALL